MNSTFKTGFAALAASVLILAGCGGGSSSSDTSAPTTTAAPSVSGTSTSGTTLAVTLNEAGTGYYLVALSSATAPTAAEVLAGTSFALTANTAASVTISGLSAATGYTIYFIAQDSAGNVQTSVQSVALTTLSWAQQAYLKAPNAGANDNFGWSIAVSGDTVVVGAYVEASSQTSITNGATASSDDSAFGAGAAYVFTRSGSTWTQQAYLKAPNAGENDYFGTSVAVSGDTVVVGATGEDSSQTSITNGTTASSDNLAFGAGAAYVFTRSGTAWTQQAYLKAPNAGEYDSFGISVAVSGDTVVVGAYGEASNQTSITNGTTASSDNSASNAGAAYVFTRSGTAWTQQAYLKAPNAGEYDSFGRSVAVSGDTVVVGATGEDSSQTSITNGTTASSDDSASKAGAAYVFTRSGTAWTQQAYLKAPNAGESDQFGTNVAVSGDTVVVAAPYESSNQTSITNGATASSDDSASHAGAAYVFTRSGSTWTQQAYLKAPNTEADDIFGFSVALSGDTVVVGATGEDSSQTSITNGTTASSDNKAVGAGAVYVFTRSGSTWTQDAYLKAPNAEAGDYFGTSVALSGDTVVVGATGEDSSQTSITNGTTASSDNNALTAGAAYVFLRE